MRIADHPLRRRLVDTCEVPRHHHAQSDPTGGHANPGSNLRPDRSRAGA